MKRSLMLVSVLALVAASAVYAAEGKAKPARPHGGPGEYGLLPPPLVGELNLSADQKTKYDGIEADYKAAAKKYREDHPITEADREAMRKAHESGDKEAMKKFAEQRKGYMELRKTYVDQVRAILTEDQTKKLDEARAKMAEHRGARGDKK